MRKMINRLNRPFPITSQRRKLFTMLPSIIIIFLLSIFKPFGLEYTTNAPYKIIGFGALTGIVLFLTLYIAPVIFKNFFIKWKWTLAKHLLTCFFIISAIAICNYLFYINTITPIYEYHNHFIFWLLITFAIGLIPATIITFIMINENLKHSLTQKQLSPDSDKSLDYEAADEVIQSKEVTISGNTLRNISLSPENILFLEAAGNYMIINHIDHNGKPTQTQLRATINQIESQLQEYERIVRCHRAFLINMSYVTETMRNSAGLLIKMHHVKKSIPVSRTYTKSVRTKLEPSTP
ncbi:MAG: LytTR family DNA-binding domain-containing protein [Dysgonomonas sp.]|nr:LytTR family DNA-binding domain-containing protein [Dysgonomonas sp.]